MYSFRITVNSIVQNQAEYSSTILVNFDLNGLELISKGAKIIIKYQNNNNNKQLCSPKPIVFNSVELCGSRLGSADLGPHRILKDTRIRIWVRAGFCGSRSVVSILKKEERSSHMPSFLREHKGKAFLSFYVISLLCSISYAHRT